MIKSSTEQNKGNNNTIQSVSGASHIQLAVYVGIGTLYVISHRTLMFLNQFGLSSFKFADLDVSIRRFFDAVYAEEVISKLLGALYLCVVGAGLYLIAWGVYCIYVNGYNDIHILSSFKFPKNEQRQKFQRSTLARVLISTSSGVLLFAWLLLGIKSILPATIIRIDSILASKVIIEYLYLLLVPFASIVYFHCVTVLLRLTLLRRRVF